LKYFSGSGLVRATMWDSCKDETSQKPGCFHATMYTDYDHSFEMIKRNPFWHGRPYCYVYTSSWYYEGIYFGDDGLPQRDTTSNTGNPWAMGHKTWGDQAISQTNLCTVAKSPTVDGGKWKFDVPKGQHTQGIIDFPGQKQDKWWKQCTAKSSPGGIGGCRQQFRDTHSKQYFAQALWYPFEPYVIPKIAVIETAYYSLHGYPNPFYQWPSDQKTIDSWTASTPDAKGQAETDAYVLFNGINGYFRYNEVIILNAALDNGVDGMFDNPIRIQFGRIGHGSWGPHGQYYLGNLTEVDLFYS